jgi:hybrid cluster-associated redox disulfide protein
MEMALMENGSPVTTEQIAEMIISDVLERWPETAVIFQKYNMACVGCVVAPFYSIDAAISIYHLDREQFLAELAAAISN